MNSFPSTVDSRTTEVISMLELFKHSMVSSSSFVAAWRNMALSILKRSMEVKGRRVARIQFAHRQDTVQISMELKRAVEQYDVHRNTIVDTSSTFRICVSFTNNFFRREHTEA